MKHVLVLSTSVPHNTLTEKMIGNLLDRVGLPAATSPQDWLAPGQAAEVPLSLLVDLFDGIRVSPGRLFAGFGRFSPMASWSPWTGSSAPALAPEATREAPFPYHREVPRALKNLGALPH